MIYREPSITIVPVMCCQLSVPDGTDEAVTTQLHNVICTQLVLSCLVFCKRNCKHVRAHFDPFHS